MSKKIRKKKPTWRDPFPRDRGIVVDSGCFLAGAADSAQTGPAPDGPHEQQGDRLKFFLFTVA